MAVSSSFGSAGLTVTPDPKQVAKELRKVDKSLPKQLGQTHKRLAEYPADEAKRRAHAKGGGYVRLSKDIRPRANRNDIRVVIGGAKFPDSAGWEFGALRWPQFDKWTGDGDNAGYVIFALRRDKRWMDTFAEKVASGLSELLDPIFPEGY